ncbi:MAG: glycosyltransferase, partial [Bacteroidaceae bacterium]|nr:glycosyltransferase [Bacteroidaceae bacterium]
MNKKPKFSIITVTYNAASVIEHTLQSILAQSYRNIEFLLIDGGS